MSEGIFPDFFFDFFFMFEHNIMVNVLIAYANSVDPDQTVPEGAGLHCLPFHYVYKKQKLDQKRME